VKWFHQAADQETPALNSILAPRMPPATAVAKDLAEAVKWFPQGRRSKATRSAQFDLGRRMPTRWRRQDPVEAVKWFRKAAEQGDAGAQLNSGLDMRAAPAWRKCANP